MGKTNILVKKIVPQPSKPSPLAFFFFFFFFLLAVIERQKSELPVPRPLSLPPFPGIGPFSVAFSPLIFREAPYRGPSVREEERPGVEVVQYGEIHFHY